MAALDASDFPAVYAGRIKYLFKADDGDSITEKKDVRYFRVAHGN